MLTSANTSRTRQLPLEASVGQSIVHFEDLRLTGGVLAPQSEEADLVLVQIHFTAYQAMRPHLAELPGLPQQGHLAQSVAPPQVDQPAMRPLPQVERPVPRKGPAVRSGLYPRHPLLQQRGDVLLGMPLQVLQAGMLEA